MAENKKDIREDVFNNVAGSRIELPTLGLWILRSNHLSYPAVVIVVQKYVKEYYDATRLPIFNVNSA